MHGIDTYSLRGLPNSYTCTTISSGDYLPIPRQIWKTIRSSSPQPGLECQHIVVVLVKNKNVCESAYSIESLSVKQGNFSVKVYND